MTTGPQPQHVDIDDVARRLSQLPLFMRELPTGPVDDPGAAMQLDALKSLIYGEGDAEERAQNLKVQGDDNFRSKRFKEAVGFYTQGLAQDDGPVPQSLRRSLLSNRAACHLELGNNRSCLKDCAALIDEVGPASQDTFVLKALFRSAKALFALSKLKEADDAYAQYLTAGGKEDPATQRLVERIKSKRQYQEKLHAETTEKHRRQTLTDAALDTAVRNLGLVLPKDWSPASSRAACATEVTPPHFDPDNEPVRKGKSIPLSSPALWSSPASSTPLIFPVFLLRPLATPPTRDLILAFHSDVTFVDQIEAFNASQASFERRQPGAENIYATTQHGRILKVGPNLTLGRMIQASRKSLARGEQDGLKLVEGWCLEFYIVPAGDREQMWISEVKAQFAKEGIKAH